MSTLVSHGCCCRYLRLFGASMDPHAHIWLMHENVILHFHVNNIIVFVSKGNQAILEGL